MIESVGFSDRRAELSDFLRTRRARVSPADVGLLEGARRRTPGLRREEVALLANIGSTWYTRLEQGLPINVSAQVLDSIARALRLSQGERRHLFILARQDIPEPLEELCEKVSDVLRRALAALDPNPAYIHGRRWDLLACNRAATIVLGHDERAVGLGRNILWRFFTDPRCRLRYQWDTIGANLVAQFRSVAARYPEDESFRNLISELRARNEHFRRWWVQHDVCEVSEGFRHFYHPRAGEIILDHATLKVPDFQDMRLIVFTPEPGSESERKVRALVDPLRERYEIGAEIHAG